MQLAVVGRALLGLMYVVYRTIFSRGRSAFVVNKGLQRLKTKVSPPPPPQL
jgi:hypothetical protein